MKHILFPQNPQIANLFLALNIDSNQLVNKYALFFTEIVLVRRKNVPSIFHVYGIAEMICKTYSNYFTLIWMFSSELGWIFASRRTNNPKQMAISSLYSLTSCNDNIGRTIITRMKLHNNIRWMRFMTKREYSMVLYFDALLFLK